MSNIYMVMKEKLKEMHEKSEDTVTINCEDFIKLFQIVCYMNQIKQISNGWDD